VTRTGLTTQSVEYDALIVAGGTGTETLTPYLVVNLGEAYRHYKAIVASRAGQDLLATCSIPVEAPEVITAEVPRRGFATALREAIGWHRHWGFPPARVG
jgi:catalase